MAAAKRNWSPSRRWIWATSAWHRRRALSTTVPRTESEVGGRSTQRREHLTPVADELGVGLVEVVCCSLFELSRRRGPHSVWS